MLYQIDELLARYAIPFTFPPIEVIGVHTHGVHAQRIVGMAVNDVGERIVGEQTSLRQTVVGDQHAFLDGLEVFLRPVHK